MPWRKPNSNEEGVPGQWRWGYVGKASSLSCTLYDERKYNKLSVLAVTENMYGWNAEKQAEKWGGQGTNHKGYYRLHEESGFYSNYYGKPLAGFKPGSSKIGSD